MLLSVFVCVRNRRHDPLEVETFARSGDLRMNRTSQKKIEETVRQHFPEIEDSKQFSFDVTEAMTEATQEIAKNLLSTDSCV